MNTIKNIPVSIIELPTFSDERGDLTAINKILPFKIKRIFYIYNSKFPRGGHRHKKTTQALICLNGSVEISIQNPNGQNKILLNSPNKCLVLKPEDWHTMENFSNGSILLVLASEHYDPNDYIYEKYN